MTNSSADPHTAATARLAAAAVSGVPCPPIRDLVAADDVAGAYAIQALLIAERIAAGRRRVGRKIGLTAEAVRRQLGVDQPDSGVLLDDMRVSGTVPAGRLLQPRAEAEVAFVLAADIVSAVDGPDAARPFVGAACAAIEIVDSRIAGWDITIADTIADNASSGLFVLGAQRTPLTAFEPAEVGMTLSRNGQMASQGSGADCMGDPLAALAWLANRCIELGDPLRAGEVVLSGALGPVVPVGSGDTVEAHISALGSVQVSFA